MLRVRVRPARRRRPALVGERRQRGAEARPRRAAALLAALRPVPVLDAPSAARGALAGSLAVAVAAGVARASARTTPTARRGCDSARSIIGSGIVAQQLVARLHRHDELGARPDRLPRRRRATDFGELRASRRSAGWTRLPGLLAAQARRPRDDRLLARRPRGTAAVHPRVPRPRARRRRRAAAVRVPRRRADRRPDRRHAAALDRVPAFSRGSRGGQARARHRARDPHHHRARAAAAAVAIAIKLDSRGPVLFVQRRRAAEAVLPPLQVPLDAGRRDGRGPRRRRDRQADRRRAHHARRAVHPALLARRGAAALQRPERRHEPRRPPSPRRRGGGGAARLAGAARRPPPRPHRPVAGRRPLAHPLPGDGELRLPVRRRLVARARHRDPARDAPRRHLRVAGPTRPRHACASSRSPKPREAGPSGSSRRSPRDSARPATTSRSRSAGGPRPRATSVPSFRTRWRSSRCRGRTGRPRSRSRPDGPCAGWRGTGARTWCTCTRRSRARSARSHCTVARRCLHAARLRLRTRRPRMRRAAYRGVEWIVARRVRDRGRGLRGRGRRSRGAWLRAPRVDGRAQRHPRARPGSAYRDSAVHRGRSARRDAAGSIRRGDRPERPADPRRRSRGYGGARDVDRRGDGRRARVPLAPPASR